MFKDIFVSDKNNLDINTLENFSCWAAEAGSAAWESMSCTCKLKFIHSLRSECPPKWTETDPPASGPLGLLDFVFHALLK